MNEPIVEKNVPIIPRYDRMHFGIIKFVHETLYGLFVNPFETLGAAELREGQRVLEVGCGPGYFTIPAGEIVGATGHVDALDINPVRWSMYDARSSDWVRKISRSSLPTQVKPACQKAVLTSPSSSA